MKMDKDDFMSVAFIFAWLGSFFVAMMIVAIYVAKA